MNEIAELKVEVQQKVGTIHWNFEELKAALGREMERYSNVIYDDSMIRTAKDDVADLRKLRKAIEDKRKEIKHKCMEPYDTVEKQAKELTALIDKPIAEIDKQVKEYEEEQKQKKRAEIEKYMDEVFTDLPEQVLVKLKTRTYDSRWENKTAKKKDWQDAVNAAHIAVCGDYEVLNGIEEDFRGTAINVYQTNLVLSEALNKVQELRRQKETILEQERRKQEEAERRRAEQEARRQAERQRQEEIQARAEERAQAAVKAEPEPMPFTESAQGAAAAAVVQKEVEPQENHAQMEYGQSANTIMRNAPQTVQIIGTEQQYKKILAYIKFVGADYVEV